MNRSSVSTLRRTAVALVLALGVPLVAGAAPASAAPKPKAPVVTTGVTLNGVTLNGVTLNGVTPA